MSKKSAHKSAKKARRQQGQTQTQATSRQAVAAHGPRPVRKPVSRTPVWVAPAAVVAVLALLVAVFLVYRYYTTPQPPKAPSSATTDALVAAITSIPASQFDTVGQGTATNLIKPVSGAPLVGSSGKPEVLYIGAEYCPFCAAQRWALIIALSRFGTFSGLETTTSSSTDAYPNTATWTFRKASFTSLNVDFRAVELEDRNQNQLQKLSADDEAVMAKYNPSGSIPFVDFGNRYAFTGAMNQPDSLANKTWDTIATDLQNTDAADTKAIIGSANLVTAAICRMTSDQPADVCSSTTIQDLEKKLG